MHRPFQFKFVFQQFIGHVIFSNVADIVNRFPAYLFSGNKLDIAKPDYVFSMPKIMKIFFLYHRKLLGQLGLCASRSLTEFLRLTLNRRDGVPGLIAAIHIMLCKKTV